MAAILNVTIRTMERKIKRNRILLSAHEKFLNFKANNLISATNKNEKISAMIRSTTPLLTNSETKVSPDITKGNALMNSALAGVGSPINESVWRSSILNFASLSAENAAIVKAT